MAAFTVRTPEPGWTGEVGGVTFADGVATIDDQTHPTVLAYCRTAGYQVEPIEEPEEPKAENPVEPESFDPAQKDVPAVLAYVERAAADEAVRVFDAEAAGKNRKGVMDQREQVMARKENDQ